MADHTVSEGTGVRRSPYYAPGALSSPARVVAVARLAARLADPDWRPTREQVAYLIDRAWRLGREWAYDEIMSRAWVTGQPFSARAVDAAGRQRARRAAWDSAAGQARDGDHPGGPVKAW